MKIVDAETAAGQQVDDRELARGAQFMLSGAATTLWLMTELCNQGIPVTRGDK